MVGVGIVFAITGDLFAIIGDLFASTGESGGLATELPTIPRPTPIAAVGKLPRTATLAGIGGVVELFDEIDKFSNMFSTSSFSTN